MNNLWFVLMAVIVINFVASIGVSLFISGNGSEPAPMRNTCCFMRATFPYLADVSSQLQSSGIAALCQKECRMFYRCPHPISDCADFHMDPDCCTGALSLTHDGIVSSQCTYNESTQQCEDVA